MNTETVRAPRRLKLDEMSKEEAQMAIAHDVVAQIKKGRYEAVRGSYVEIDETAKDLDPSFQCMIDLARAGARGCEVCAVGAGVVSAGGLFNGPKFNRPINFGLDYHKILSKFFSPLTVAEIECAFEVDPHWLNKRRKTMHGVRCSDWGGQWNDSADRLEAIYTNLIANNGEFNVEWTPSPRTRLGRAMTKDA